MPQLFAMAPGLVLAGVTCSHPSHAASLSPGKSKKPPCLLIQSPHVWPAPYSTLHCPAAAAALIETSRDILINAAPPVTPPSQPGDTGVQTGGSSSHRISPALTWLLLRRSPMGIFRYYCHSSPFLHTPPPLHASSILRGHRTSRKCRREGGNIGQTFCTNRILNPNAFCIDVRHKI